MASKFDQLRQGLAVEVEPGLGARLNKEKKRLELSSGEFFDVADHPDLFPRDEQALALSREKEQIQRGIGQSPLGEFGFQFANQGLLGGAKDWIDYATQGKNYAAKKAAQHQVSQEISRESPYMSAAATAASFIPDIALTKGLSGMAAAPLLAAGHAGSRLITDPTEVAKEAAIGAAGGFALDKVGGYLSNVAARRGASQALPAQQAAVREANALGQQAVNQTNAQQQQAFGLLKQGIKNTNEARLQQHAAELTARQNRMIQAQNAFEAQKAARDANVLKLKNDFEIAKAQRAADTAQRESAYLSAKSAAEAENKRLSAEFKLAQDQYKQALAEMPSLQAKAQQEYSKNVIRTAKEIEKSFPASSKITPQEIGVEDFISRYIDEAGLAGSKEGGQVSRILKGLFPEGQSFGGRQLSKKYQGIEQAIQRSTPEVRALLNDFKYHLGQVLPTVVEDAVAYTTIVPILKRTLANDVKSILSSVGLDRSSAKAVDKITSTTLQNATNAIKNEVGAAGFVKKIESGEFARELANKIATFEDFLVDLTPHNINFLKKEGTFPVIMENAQRQHAAFIDQLTQKIQNRISSHELKAVNAANSASERLGGGLANVKYTYGEAPPIRRPNAPVEPSYMSMPEVPGDLPPLMPPNMPPPISPPPTLPIPPKPTMLPPPGSPIPHTFTPQAEPTLPPAQGLADVTGDLLEKNILGGGKSLIDNPLTKLAGLKYLLGGAAAPVEAAYLGMKGLTSPTAAGEMARATFKQGGIQAVDAWAQRYPSYHDGILENPQERRSLTKEIEDDPEIPIEQKAVLQSKVNRGKPLSQRLS